MAEEEESYCRLCAEPTAKTQLIAPDEDVGLNSKIARKMMWINIDISAENTLPNSICFSCFDLLERTWSFLHNVRTAQTKLFEIFLKKDKSNKSNMKSDTDLIGKPVNEDWEDFEELKQEVKPEIFNEELELVAVDPKSLLEASVVVKIERDSVDDFRPDSDDFNSTDSDVPLYQTVKKKAVKKKKEMRYNSDGLKHLEPKNELDNETLTWVDCKCVCADCETQCDNITLLRIHAIQIHNHCCIFKCADCGKVTSTNRTFINHMRKHKKVLRNCCEYCDKDFENYTYLRNHRKLMHQDAIQMTCRSCGTMFENPDDLKDHIIKYSKSIKKHNMKRANKELKCNMCDKEFKTHASMQTHKLLHTERPRNFSCHICGKMFFTKGSLGTHLVTHEDTKQFKCEFCPMTFRARGNLSAHRTIHFSVKPFVCEQCGKSFRAKRHLKSHSIIHTDLMPYVCNFCKKTFRFKTRLNLHIRQHTGLKPYKCTYCQREFTNGSNYKKHMKRKHNIDTSKKKYNNVVNDNLDISKDKLHKEDS